MPNKHKLVYLYMLGIRNTSVGKEDAQVELRCLDAAMLL
jgi:hypothetical protein